MYLLYHVTCISLYPVFWYTPVCGANIFYFSSGKTHIVQFGENDNSMLSLKSLGGKGNPLAADNQGELLLGEGGLLGYR